MYPKKKQCNAAMEVITRSKYKKSVNGAGHKVHLRSGRASTTSGATLSPDFMECAVEAFFIFKCMYPTSIDEIAYFH